MLEDEALKFRYIIRQRVDIEHAWIIPAASDVRAAFCLFYRSFGSLFCEDQITCAPLHRTARVNTIRIQRCRSTSLRLPPIDPFEQHR